MSSNKTFLFGYSGHALVVHDCLQGSNHHVVGYFDLNENPHNPLSLDYCGDECQVNIRDIIKDDFGFPAVGQNGIREKLIHLIRQNNIKETQAIHNTVILSDSAVIGVSTMLGPGSIINARVSIGDGVIVNTGAIVEHGCKIDDYCHIAPGTILAGDVTVEKGTFIGAGSVIKEGIRIGKNVIVGAGSVVINDIPDDQIWMGVPAKLKKKH